MVVWHHTLIQIPGMSEVIKIREFGYTGVDIFFVISGFIMVVTTAKHPISCTQFFTLRVIRVVPLYWLITALTIALALTAPALLRTVKVSPEAIVKSMLFIPYESLSFPGNMFPIVVPGWTLNYEMFFYALFSLSLFLPRRAQVYAMLSALGCLVIAGMLIPHRGIVASAYTNPYLLEFGMGMLIAQHWLQHGMRIRPAMAILAILAGFFILVHSTGQYCQLIGASLVMIGTLHPAMGAIDSWLLTALGNASYSIYLTHLFSLALLRWVWVRLMPTVSMGSTLAFLAAGLVLSSIIGYRVHIILEKPMTGALQRFVKSPRGRAVSAVA